ncbi:unnamed protein product [Acanthoscelides obtectus]|uniref:Uncharacterized protein n=1 Tax=Acanthoscelides obtectus TaxID=200917 RepID=A0A9P0Q8N7_ACAOB|nr:unnamed protein product [Acanthoscelides obtectus]CAK1672582.1 hypothetical protein AOBTE_LOCUS28981 [Acanthoscelides obtectus]
MQFCFIKLFYIKLRLIYIIRLHFEVMFTISMFGIGSWFPNHVFVHLCLTDVFLILSTTCIITSPQNLSLCLCQLLKEVTENFY